MEQKHLPRAAKAMLTRTLSICLASVCLLSFTLTGCTPSDLPSQPTTSPSSSPSLKYADTIYHSGNVITVDESFSLAQAVAVKDGLILAVGSDDIVDQYAAENTVLVDLHGKAMMPGIYDSHGHLNTFMMAGNWANLQLNSADFYSTTPNTMDDIVAALIQYKEEKGLSDEAPIIGWGYHESRLVEKRMPTKEDLDRVSTTQPVIAINLGMHVYTLNSKALEMMGIDESTPDPEGCKIYRVEGTNEPNGQIQGTSIRANVLEMFNDTSTEAKLAGFEAAQMRYLSVGITTAQEGLSRDDTVATLTAAGEAGSLILDVIAYPSWNEASKLLREFPAYQGGEYVNHVKIIGEKIQSDGTLSSGAFLTQPFQGTEDNYGLEYISSEDMESAIREAFQNGRQVIVHAMGDAAIDKFMSIYEQVAKEEGMDVSTRRDVIIHSSAMRRDQMPKAKELNLICSFYSTASTGLYELYCQTLGKARADLTHPMQSAINAGIVTTLHNDAPIAGPDPFIMMYSAVNRVSVLTNTPFGPEERISVEDAIRSMTINGAYQHFEEDIKGSIEPGKHADLIILNADPLTLNPLDFQILKTLETIKDGVSVYKAGE